MVSFLLGQQVRPRTRTHITVSLRDDRERIFIKVLRLPSDLEFLSSRLRAKVNPCIGVVVPDAHVCIAAYALLLLGAR